MTAIKQIEDALKVIGVSSLVIGNLPENPGYNGSVLLIDDDEAERISKELDSAADNLREATAHIAAQDAEIARLREALTDLFGADMEHFLMLDGKDDQIEAIAKARAALATTSKGAA